jgi:hypothetical protein
MGIPFDPNLGYRSLSGMTLDLPGNQRFVGVMMLNPGLASADRFAA